MKEYFSFKSEMSELEKKINATGVAEKLKSFNQRLEDANSRIEKNSGEHHRLKNDVARTANLIESLRNDIEASIMNIFNEEVKIGI